MKKINMSATALIVAIMLGLLLSGGLIAQQDSAKSQNQAVVQEKSQTQTKLNDGDSHRGRAMNFIDENGNGICDRFEQHQSMGHNAGRGMGHGPNFIDEDGDGICDHRSGGGMHNGGGHGNHSKRGPGSMGSGRRN